MVDHFAYPVPVDFGIHRNGAFEIVVHRRLDPDRGGADGGPQPRVALILIGGSSGAFASGPQADSRATFRCRPRASRTIGFRVSRTLVCDTCMPDRLRPRLEDRRLAVAGPAARRPAGGRRGRGQPLPRLRPRPPACATTGRDSTTACAPASVATSPIWSTPCRTCPPAA